MKPARGFDHRRGQGIDLCDIVAAEQEQIAGERVEDDGVGGFDPAQQTMGRERREVDRAETAATAIIACGVKRRATAIEGDSRDCRIIAARLVDDSVREGTQGNLHQRARLTRRPHARPVRVQGDVERGATPCADGVVRAGAVGLNFMDAVALTPDDQIAVGGEGDAVGAADRADMTLRPEDQARAVEPERNLFDVRRAAITGITGVVELARNRVGEYRGGRQQGRRRDECRLEQIGQVSQRRGLPHADAGRATFASVRSWLYACAVSQCTVARPLTLGYRPARPRLPGAVR